MPSRLPSRAAGTAPRFSPPPRPIPAPRYRHGGLGAEVNEPVPQGDSERIRHLEETIPGGGFFGIRSRTRFFKMLTPRPQGHGKAQAPPDVPTQGPDPAAGKTEFPALDADHTTLGAFPGPLPERMAGRSGNLPTAGLDIESRELVDDGFLHYQRKRVPASVAALVPIGPPRWSDAGPPPQTYRNERYTYRREFEQGAQAFSGIRFTLRRGAHVSTSPVRMLPPRPSYLTQRDLPTSLGSTQEVLTDAQA